ncbi:MAG: GYDIA family GHMP kinase, partial [Saprospiraceae bacterium]
WGLGTSSTLLAALARWAKVDPYRILANTLGGSGYDLACAYAEGPVFYHVENAVPSVEPVDFSPAFADQLFFVFLGKKQNSRLGIAHYRALPGKTRAEIEEVSQLTRRFTAATTLPEFEQVIAEHETFVQQKLDLPKVREGLFPDYWGEIKSLGAWGGDFVLVTSNRSLAETQTFFNEKGYPVFIPYAEMTVSPPHLSF